jgi:HAD domain in Swiss Army Knife RNA repair proteins
LKVIFLDIDGVLNTPEERRNEPPETALRRSCVLLLNLIIEYSGAHVVISSHWRVIYTIEDIVNFLTLAGFAYGDRVIGCTPIHRDGHRGNEIHTWRMQHPEVINAVYLDDEDEEYDGSDHLIQTSARTGLTDEVAARVIRSLNEYDIS